MALQSLPFGLLYPTPPAFSNETPSAAVDFVGDNTAKIAHILQVPRDGVIDAYECYVSPASSPTMRISFQDVDPANGNPDGTEDQYRDLTPSSGWNAIATMDSAGGSGGTKRTVSAGDRLAVVFRIPSGGGSINVRYLDTYSVATQTVLAGAMYHAMWNGSSWTKAINMPLGALRYVTDGLVPIGDLVVPASGFSAAGFASDSSPDERALRFMLPFGATLRGLWVRLKFTDDIQAVLYDGSSSVILTPTFDKDISASSTGSNRLFRFASSPTLSPNTLYRLAIKPQNTGTGVTTYDFTLPSSSYLPCFPPGDSSWYLSTRTDGGSWTDTLTSVPIMGLWLDGIDAGGGGGSFPFVG